MPKLKSGEYVTWTEALKRFKKGVEDITPIQKLENELRGTFITLLGFVFSLIAVIWKRDAIGLLAYGLMLIFLGSSITTGLRYLGLRQQVMVFKNLENESLNLNLEEVK
jgi:hypothetical protein